LFLFLFLLFLCNFLQFCSLLSVARISSDLTCNFKTFFIFSLLLNFLIQNKFSFVKM
jgi:hypothetical protein